MSQTRIKRSYDMFATSSSSSSDSSSSTSLSPSHPTSFDSPFESAHKRSRFASSLHRQMSEEDSAMSQLSPTSSSSPAQPSSALVHEAITSSALSSLSSAAAGLRATSPPSSRGAAFPSYRHPSPFVARDRIDVPAFVDSFPVKRKRPHTQMEDALHSPQPHKQAHLSSSSSPSPLSSLPSPPSPPVLYTLDQVKRIVTSALQLQEERLREEYEKVLNDLLREQFENFERFNKDYISRQIAKTDLSYLS